MNIIIPTGKKRVALRLYLSGPCAIKGTDAQSGMLYFAVEESKEYSDIYLPISPNRLNIFSECEIEGISAAPLWQKPDFEPEENAFFDFLEKFAPNAHQARPGIYRIDGTPYQLHYHANRIIDHRAGLNEDTPAVSDHELNIIHASRNVFRRHSVPTISATLVHELTHLATGDRGEELPDLNAAYTCLQYGFSKIEVGYVFTKLIPDTEPYQSEDQKRMNLKRAEEISNYIAEFQPPYVDL